MLRNKEMRENAAVRYFLTQQEDFESFLGNVGLYSQALKSLQSIQTKNLSIDMLKAVALSGLDSTTGEPSAEPESLAIRIPDMESH